MRKFLIFIICMQQSLQLTAQSNSNSSGLVEVRKEYQKTLFQVAPRIDFVLDKPKINIYLAGAINTEGAYKSIVENRQWYAQAGIDMAVAEKWYIGLSTRANGGASGYNVYNYTTRFYVQHRGKLGKLIVLKEALYEQFNFAANTEYNVTPTGSSYSRRSTEGRFGLGFGLGRFFPLNENHFAIFLSYRAYLQFDFENNGNSIYKNRFIDYTTFRLDAGYLINHVWYVGFYTTRDTNYMYVPASTPYNSNRIIPIVGIACNLMLFTKSKNEKQLSSFRYFYTQ
jgi:hypothetical protein